MIDVERGYDEQRYAIKNIKWSYIDNWSRGVLLFWHENSEKSNIHNYSNIIQVNLTQFLCKYDLFMIFLNKYGFV